MFPPGLTLPTDTRVPEWPATFAVFTSTVSQRRGRASSILPMDHLGEVMRAGSYLGPAEDDACGVFVSLFLCEAQCLKTAAGILCTNFSKMLEVFGTLKARVQGREADSETVRRTQLLSNHRGKKNNHFLSCAQWSTLRCLWIPSEKQK